MFDKASDVRLVKYIYYLFFIFKKAQVISGLHEKYLSLLSVSSEAVRCLKLIDKSMLINCNFGCSSSLHVCILLTNLKEVQRLVGRMILHVSSVAI